MIKSMTGYGRAEQEIDGKKISIEMSTVNHRYCDINIRMPKILAIFEDQMRKLIKESVSRGKLEVNIFYSNTSAQDVEVVVNKEICESYVSALRDLGKQLGVKDDLGISHLLGLSDVVTLQKKASSEEELWQFIEGSLKESIQQLMTMRLAEGALLKEDLRNKVHTMEEAVKELEAMSPEITRHYQGKLEERLAKLLKEVPVDETRIALEVAVFADKCCIDEEITRLRSHLSQLTELLEQEEPVGRKLDFLMQEMNREANTIASKANSYQITNYAVTLKTEIEKMREQIQNIE